MGIVWYNSFTFTFNVFNPCRKKYKKGFLIKNWTDTRGFSTKPFRKALPHKRIFVFSKFLLPSLRLLDINFKLFHGVSTESCPAEWLNPFQPFHSICLGVFGVRQFLFRGSVRPAKGNGHTFAATSPQPPGQVGQPATGMTTQAPGLPTTHLVTWTSTNKKSECAFVINLLSYSKT